MTTRFATQASAVLSGTALTYVGAFAVSKVIAVEYGPSGVGLVGALMAFAALCGTLALAGQLNYIPVWTADNADRAHEVVGLSSRAVLLTGGPVLLVGLLLLGLAVPSDGPWPVLALGFVLLVVANVVGLQRTTLGSALGDGRRVAAFQGTAALVTALVTIPLVLLLPASALPLVLGAGLAAGFVVAGVPLMRSVATSGTAPSWSRVRAFIAAGAPTLFGTVGNALVWTGLPVIVVYLVGSYDAGLFRSSWTIATAIWSVAYSVLKVVYFPEVSRHAARGEDPSAFQRSSAGPVMVVAALVAAATALAAPLLLHLLFSSEFVPSSAALALLAAGALARTWTTVNGFDLLAEGHQRSFSVVEGVSMGLLVVGVVVASRFGGVTLLAATVTAAFVAGAVLSEIALRRAVPHRSSPCLSWPPIIWACGASSLLALVLAGVRS